MAEQYLDMNDFHNMPGTDRLRFIYYAAQMGNGSGLTKDDILELLRWMVSRFLRVKETENATAPEALVSRNCVRFGSASLEALAQAAERAEQAAAEAKKERRAAAEKLAQAEKEAAAGLDKKRLYLEARREAAVKDAQKEAEANAGRMQRILKLREMYGGEQFTEDELLEMDKTFRALADEYKGSLTPRMKMSLEDLAKMRVLRDRSISNGDEQAAAKYQAMYDKIMAGEALKVGDSKPLKNMRIDALADALERAGCLGDGKLLDKDGVIRYIRGNKGDYEMSLDVVDEIMLLMENARRKNAGEAEVNVLPLDLQVQDEFHELHEKQTEFEKQTMADLGLIAPEREG